MTTDITINKLKTFYHNHPLSQEHKRLINLCNLKYNHEVNDENIYLFNKSELKNYKVNTDYSRKTYLQNKKDNIAVRISKDIHAKFKNLKLNHKTEKFEVFGYETWGFFRVKMTGEYSLTIMNPLSREYEEPKLKINHPSELKKLVENFAKSKFIGNGEGNYASIQMVYRYTIKQLIQKIKDLKMYRESEYFLEEKYDHISTLKSIKRNLGLIIPEHLDEYHIRNMVNKVGTKNKGKKPIAVWRFDTSNIDTDGNIDEIESRYYQEYRRQSKNAILI